jgi:phage terminase small subunit
MKALTVKQENFCLAYINNNGKASDAYRSVYNAGTMSSHVIHVKANELMNNSKLIKRISELRQPAVQNAQITLTQHLNDLLDLRNKAIDAEIARGKASGLYVDRIQSDVTISIGFADRIKEARERVIEQHQNLHKHQLKVISNEPNQQH